MKNALSRPDLNVRYSGFRRGILWAWRVAMDIGFGSLIKEFDERIGRAPTTILLGLIFLAGVAVCVSTIYTVLVVPLLPAAKFLFDFLTGVNPGDVTNIALKLGLGLGASVIWLVLFMLGIRVAFRIRRRYDLLVAQDEAARKASGVPEHLRQFYREKADRSPKGREP